MFLYTLKICKCSPDILKTGKDPEPELDPEHRLHKTLIPSSGSGSAPKCFGSGTLVVGHITKRTRLFTTNMAEAQSRSLV
jgi:hypothetical protein